MADLVQEQTSQPQSKEFTLSPSKRTASTLNPDNSYSSITSKRICASPTSTTPPITTTNHNNHIQVRTSQLSIHAILHLPEDAVWSLCKADLRNIFLALQSYTRAPYPLSSPLSPLTTPQTLCPPRDLSTPSILRLPLEIRQQIYAHCLPAPVVPPIRGPHPRQLQNPLHLTQPVPGTLLLLNHQIRLEALPVLYGVQTQTAHIMIDYNIWAHKTKRSDLVLSSLIPSSLRHIHVTLSLGSEKRPLISPSSSASSSHSTTNPPLAPSSSTPAPEIEASARLLEIKKGIKKLCKWLAGADIRTLTVSWQEPPQTYSWEVKREVLDGLKGLRAESVVGGCINWGLEGRGKWNRGRKYRFEVEYLGRLQRDACVGE